MRKKYFVFSDVHGEYDALIEALSQAGYNKEDNSHILLSLGDNFDRGPKSREIYEFLTQNKAICIKGNHDLFLQEALLKGLDGEYVLFNILHNGLYNTLCSFARTEMPSNFKISNVEQCLALIEDEYGRSISNWIANMPLYFETKNYVFSHAGVDPRLTNWKDTTENFMLWDIEYSHIPCDNVAKTIIFGHHHAFRVRDKVEEETYLDIPFYGCTDNNRPVRIGNKIAIDPCSNLTHKINVLVIEDEEI